MIKEFIFKAAGETLDLFIDMAPFLILGMLITGILSVIITRATVARYTGDGSWWSAVRAALLGVPLPLCSCGVLPTAMYLKDNGASMPAVQSFLISTPQTGVDSLLATYALLGPLFAIYRAFAAFMLGIAGGLVSLFFNKSKNTALEPVSIAPAFEQPAGNRLSRALHYGFVEFIDDIGGHFVIGLLVAGVLTALIPDGFFTSTHLGSGITGMMLMIAVSIPIYMCSTSSIPIAVALMAKGISPGAAFVLLAAGPATNIATLMVLRKKLGNGETAIYLSTLAAGSLLFGLFFDGLISVFKLDGFVRIGTAMDGHELLSAWIAFPSAFLLGGLLIYSLGKRYLFNRKSVTCCSGNCQCKQECNIEG